MLTDTNPKSFDVGEIFILEALASSESALVILVLQHWIKIHEVRGKNFDLKMIRNVQGRLRNESDQEKMCLKNS